MGGHILGAWADRSIPLLHDIHAVQRGSNRYILPTMEWYGALRPRFFSCYGFIPADSHLDGLALHGLFTSHFTGLSAPLLLFFGGIRLIKFIVGDKVDVHQVLRFLGTSKVMGTMEMVDILALLTGVAGTYG